LKIEKRLWTFEAITVFVCFVRLILGLNLLGDLQSFIYCFSVNGENNF